MKDKIKKIITFIGFLVVVSGGVIAGLGKGAEISTLIASVFAVCFIFADNKTLNNFGYAIAGIGLPLGVTYFWITTTMVVGFGYIIMSLASIIKLIEIILAIFGYTSKESKKIKNNSAREDGFAEIEKYSLMVKDGILTEDEYSSLKSKILEVDTKKSSTIEDLKKWKKLLDNKLLTEEEFSGIKTKILR